MKCERGCAIDNDDDDDDDSDDEPFFLKNPIQASQPPTNNKSA